MRAIKNNILYIIIILGIAILVAMPKVNAQVFSADGNPADTESQEVITILNTEETFGYQDANLNQKPTVSADSNISYSVFPEYGFTMNPDNPNQTVTPGDIRYQYYGVTNEGNAGDAYTLKCFYDYNKTPPLATNWTVEVWLNPASPSFLGTLSAGSITNYIEQIVEDGDVLPYFTVYVGSTTIEAPDGSFVRVLLTSETSATPAGRYQGANDYWYGGAWSTTDEAIYQTAAPVLVLTRVFTVDAPTEGGYGGGDNDPVPGAVITFTMTYSNEGNGDANNVFVVDKVPTDTTFGHANKTGAAGNVTITPGSGSTDVTWEVWYSTDATPPFSYIDDTNWTLIGTVDGTAPDAWPTAATIYGTTEPGYLGTGGGTGVVTYVRWKRLGLIPSTEDTKTITWGVTIR